jgi:hypothetical protein
MNNIEKIYEAINGATSTKSVDYSKLAKVFKADQDLFDRFSKDAEALYEKYKKQLDALSNRQFSSQEQQNEAESKIDARFKKGLDALQVKYVDLKQKQGTKEFASALKQVANELDSEWTSYFA